MLHIASTIVLLLVATGLILRHRPEVHPKIMFSAFTMDLLLVLYIEFTRGAIEKVSSEFAGLLWLHAGISTAVLAAYVAMIVLGRRLASGRVTSRATHRNLGIIFCVLRSLNYVTSYMV